MHVMLAIELIAVVLAERSLGQKDVPRPDAGSFGRTPPILRFAAAIVMTPVLVFTALLPVLEAFRTSTHYASTQPW